MTLTIISLIALALLLVALWVQLHMLRRKLHHREQLVLTEALAAQEYRRHSEDLYEVLQRVRNRIHEARVLQGQEDRSLGIEVTRVLDKYSQHMRLYEDQEA